MLKNSITRLQGSLLSAVFLIFTTCFFFGSAIFENQILLSEDQFRVDYPLRYYWITSLWKGYPAFVNTAIDNGQPILSNFTYAVLYPGNAIYFFLSFENAWNFSLIAHYLLSATGLIFLSRTHGFGIVPSIAGALSYACSAPVIAALGFYNLAIASSWTPWIWGFALKSMGAGSEISSERPKISSLLFAFAALALGMQILAGEPSVVLLTLFTFGVFVILRVSDNRISVRTYLGICLCGSGVAAAQIFPTVLWTNQLSLWSAPATKENIYPLIVSLLICIFGWKSRWGRWGLSLALIFAGLFLLKNDLVLILYALFGLSFAVTTGTATLMKMRGSVAGFLVLIVIFFEAAMLNRTILNVRTQSSVIDPPRVVQEVPELRYRSISVHPEESRTSMELLPWIGLRWKINYSGMDHFPDLNRMKEAGTNFVLSSSPIRHNELHLMKTVTSESGQSDYVYNLQPYPFARFQRGNGTMSWLNAIPHRLYFRIETKEQGEIVAARRALPGWEIFHANRWEPIPESSDGWIHIPVNPGKYQINLRYRPPGLIPGLFVSGFMLLFLTSLIFLK